MTRPPPPVVTLGGAYSEQIRRGVGFVQVLNAQLSIVCRVGPLIQGAPLPIRLPSSGHYVAQVRMSGGEAFSKMFEVPTGQRAATLLLAPVAGEAATSAARGWVAAWQSVPTARSFVPVGGDGAVEASRSLVIPARADANDNAVLQWSVGGEAPEMVVVPAGTHLRLRTRQGKTWAQPEADAAAGILEFLHTGDIASASGLLSAGTENGARADVFVDIAAGYCLLKSGSDRLAAHARELASRRPLSTDAQLLLGWAMLHDPEAWHLAEEHLFRAVSCGIPVFPGGFRLLDDCLRLLSQGRADAIRSRLLPYQRTLRGTVLSTFWGRDPNTPAFWPTPVEPPEHAQPCAFTAEGVEFLVGQRPPAEQRAGLPDLLAAAVARLGRVIAVGTLRVSTGGMRVAQASANSADQGLPDSMLMLDVPEELRRSLGPSVVAEAVRTDQGLLVILSNVTARFVAVSVSPDTASWTAMEPLSSDALFGTVRQDSESEFTEFHLAVLDASVP
ncbi:hypothetical protein ACIRQQ_15820 [Streptomyces fuscichromogenes]|uniref:hypothetical protein n=1 Tax=Streptomyces fuscichromogenes TaxID=1324013 RepID=UPI00382A422E